MPDAANARTFGRHRLSADRFSTGTFRHWPLRRRTFLLDVSALVVGQTAARSLRVQAVGGSLSSLAAQFSDESALEVCIECTIQIDTFTFLSLAVSNNVYYEFIYSNDVNHSRGL